MRTIIFALGILFVFSCSKTDKGSIATPNVVTEESIKFTSNIDTVTYNLIDTLPLIINVSSKIPSSGLLYSITVSWLDSAKQIFKLDTSLNQSNLNLNIPGFKKAGSYTVSIIITSKTNSSNSITKTISLSRNNFSISTTTIALNISGFTKENIATGIDGSVSGTIFTAINGKVHLTVSPTLFFNNPLLPSLDFIKNGNSWALENSYLSGAMGAGRNYELMDSARQIWAIADHGLELSSGTWPFGSIYVMKQNGDGLSYTNISNSRSFYHSVSTGDLNNDGLKDIVGLNMGTKGDWYDNLHTYLQNSDGSFSENRTILVSNLNNRGAGAVLIKDLFGDSRPEVIRADYGFNSSYQKQSDRYSFMIFSFNPTTNKYELVKDPGPLGVFANNDRGTTSIKAADFDNDGDLDLALATEGTNFMGIEIWINDGQGNFLPSPNKIEFTFDQMQFREFNVIDVNNDGWLDIVLNPFAFGKLFRVGGSGNDLGTGGVYLNNLLWMNNKGAFSFYNKQIIVPNIKPAYLKSSKFNGQFKFIGVQTDATNGSVNIYDIPFVF